MRRFLTLRRFVCWLVFSWLHCLPAIHAADETKTKQIRELRAEITHHDELYFEKAAPEITDFEYDLLKSELRRLEAEVGLANPGDTGITDGSRSTAVLLPHGRRMLSLDKAYSDAEVAVFLQRVADSADGHPFSFIVEPKIDGVAINVVLKRGRFQSASIRGDGSMGEDVSAQVAQIRGFEYEWEFDVSPSRIEEIELRGEIYLTHEAFNALNEIRAAKGEPPFRHPRNVAAGAIRLDDLAAVASRGLSIAIHGWGEVQPAEAAPKSVTNFKRWLRDRGLPGVPSIRTIENVDAEQLATAARILQQRSKPYPTDGVVIKVDSVALQQELGESSTAPRWALARKFAPPRALTVLRDIEWRVGRTGAVTPVAQFDPVQLGGATITQASLHGAAEIERRDIRLGDHVWIEKAGEIIPQLAGVEGELRSAHQTRYSIPTHCPECARSLESDEGATDLRCPNFNCREQLVQRLIHFSSRGAMGISGLGPGMARKLVDSGLVESPADLYELGEEQLTALSGIGIKTASRLIEAIESSRTAPLDRMLVGLGLPGVGPSGATAVAQILSDLDQLLEKKTQVAALAPLGPVISVKVSRFLDREDVREVISRLAESLQ